MNLWIFLIVETFSQCHYKSYIKTKPLKFALLCRVKLIGIIFLKSIKQQLVVFSFLCLVILKMVHSQNDETIVLEVIKIKFLSLLNHGLQAFAISLNIFSMDFTIWWWHICKFLKNHKSKRSLNLSFHHYQGFINLQTEKRNCKKSSIPFFNISFFQYIIWSLQKI